MAKEVPDHHDAELVLRVYEMRREAVMRASRDALTRDFWPGSYEDVQAVFLPTHPLNTAFRQVSTYWEMVYSFARHGVVHADFFLETNGEGLLLFAKLEPYLAQIRKDLSGVAFQNAEWVAANTAPGRLFIERFRARIPVMRAMLAKKAAAPEAPTPGPSGLNAAAPEKAEA